MRLIALLSLAAAVIILALAVEGYRPPEGRAAGGSSAALGDANCDTTVNSIDASLVLQFAAGLIDTVECPETADANGDERIDSVDAALILQHDAGFIRLSPLDISGRWQYDQEADYFLFDKEQSLADGAVIYTYEEICATNGRVKGTGTATVRGNSVSMEGADDISDYLLEMDASPDGTRLSGVRTRSNVPEFPDVHIVLVKGAHPSWTETVCDLFS